MGKLRVVHTSQCETYRIVEHLDEHFRIDDLKGDMFRPSCVPDMDPIQLRQEEIAFENEAYNMGVYGYELQRWNPKPDHGWEHVESCWGFVGSYDPKQERYSHYIVDEFKGLIEVTK